MENPWDFWNTDIRFISIKIYFESYRLLYTNHTFLFVFVMVNIVFRWCLFCTKMHSPGSSFIFLYFYSYWGNDLRPSLSCRNLARQEGKCKVKQCSMDKVCFPKDVEYLFMRGVERRFRQGASSIRTRLTHMINNKCILFKQTSRLSEEL